MIKKPPIKILTNFNMLQIKLNDLKALKFNCAAILFNCESRKRSEGSKKTGPKGRAEKKEKESLAIFNSVKIIFRI